MTSEVGAPGEAPSTITVGQPLALEARELSAGYGDAPVLHDITLQVPVGQIVVLLGANGAGKTTLLLTLAGRLPRLSGEVRSSGAVTKAPLYKRARQGLSLVTDDRGIFRSLTAADNLRVGGVTVGEALGLFPELQPRLNIVAGLLSGGEQQMLTLARALARRPKVLLLDELSLGLAPMIVERLLARLVEAAEQTGTAVLLVEQHVRKALAVANYGYILSRGRITLEGTASSLRARMTEIESSYLSGAQLPPEGSEVEQ